MINGMGPNTREIENDRGGKQSDLPFAFDQIDPDALFKLASVLHHGGMKYGRDNWKKLTTREILNHAIAHIYAYLAEDRQDDHLSHAFTRLMMAIVVDQEHGQG